MLPGHQQLLRLALIGILFLALVPDAASAQLAGLTTVEWQEDIEVLRERLPASHIDSYHILSRSRFDAELDSIVVALDSLRHDQILVRMAALVAAVGDGHTSARILRPDLHAFPILTQAQDDGLIIRRIHREHERLIGGRIVRVEAQPVKEMLARLRSVISADNEMGLRAWLPYYVITEEVLRGLGVLDDDPGLTLYVERVDGAAERVTLSALPLDEAESLLLGEAPEMVSAGDYAEVPVRDAQSGPYWFQELPDSDAIHVRIDQLISRPDWPFRAFVDSVFEVIDRRDPDRVVLDLRSLSGGNHISLPLIHELVRRPQLAERGTLMVLIGRNTFSAGQNLVTLLEHHVDPIFIGEPTGGRPNHYGVSGRFTLPNSGIEIRFSRYFIQDADPADYRHWQEPHLYAPPDVHADMAGTDPALEAALSFDGSLPHAEMLARLDTMNGQSGVDAIVTLLQDRPGGFGSGGWMVERRVTQLGYDLLRGGRTDDAVTLFRTATELFPSAWNSWDSLGEALAVAGRTTDAAAAYERSISLNPYHENGRRALRMLALDTAERTR